MKISAISFLLLLLMASCSIKKQRRAHVVREYGITGYDLPDTTVDKANGYTVPLFQPFEVDREDGFYEVAEYTEPYPFQNVRLVQHPAVSKREIRKVKVDMHNHQRYPIVAIKFTKEGALNFEKVTEENIGKPLAIVIGGKVVSLPTVQQKISGGKMQISGNFSLEEAKQMVKTLKGE